MGAEWNDWNGSDSDLLSGSLRQIGNSAAPIRWSIDRNDTVTDVAAALTTQVMLSTAVVLRAGDIITNIGVQFGHTAAGTPTNWWYALYSSAATPALLAQTADQLTGAIAADAYKELALATAQTITTDGVYYVGIMVKATTVPSIACSAGYATSAVNGAIVTGMKQLAVTSGSALTTTAPATIATPTVSVNRPLVILR